MEEELPPFDPTNHCVKCGNKIEQEPPQPVLAASDPKKPADKPDKKVVMAPPPPPPPPNVTYCDGTACPWVDPTMDEEEVPEHMHAVCEVCGYEWLTKTLDG